MKKNVQEIIFQALQKINASNAQIQLEVPEKSDHGDFSCNVAMQLTKILKKNPREIAQDIIENIPENEIIEKVDIAGPGFLNFFVSPTFFANQLEKIYAVKKGFGKNTLLQEKFFLAEHTDPNLFKEVHVGHVMTNTIGESLSRIAKFSGGDVKNVTFQGDVGLHIAKSIWGIENIGENLPMEKEPYEKQKFLGKCYIFGEKNFSESEKAKQEIIQINKDIYTWNRAKYSNENISSDLQVFGEIYETGCRWSLEYLETIYEILGSQFDHYFLESTTFSDGERIVKENTEPNGKKVFSHSNGAIIFKGSEHGHHDRVFINSENLPTYEAKDIGLFYKKWEKYSPDISLTITGGDQDQYFKTVREAAGLINPEWKEKTIHKAHGTLKLSSGKMSSRTGNIVRAQEWVDSAKEAIIEKMQERKDIPAEDIPEIAKKIAVGAIKYSILKVSAGKDIVYDEDSALDFTGNSGPYLQYSYVRAKSILRKAGVLSSGSTHSPNSKPVSDFEKLIHHFPETVEKSLNSSSSHHIANYLYGLAKEFNSFYAHTKILDTQNPEYAKNIQLVEIFSYVMKNGLWLLGIETVEVM